MSLGPRVEQGPAWLVDLLVEPPTWVLAGLGAVAIATLGLTALGALRTELDRAVVEEIVGNGAVVTVGVVVTGVSSMLGGDYWVDVAIGGLAVLATWGVIKYSTLR